ncbi:MAG TPA: prepilin-type N-terminal cleavage/methylation domain-containing protein [Pyrinomonadaceae bacterium]|jgi:Tfp pilus assembly protein PilV
MPRARTATHARLCRSSAATHASAARTAGFTLIETMIALLLMMIVGLGATSLFIYAVRYNTGASERSMALAIAQQQLEELRAVGFDDPLLDPVSNASICDQTNPCHSGTRAYTATKTVTNSNNITVGLITRPTLKTITIRVTPLRSGIPWTANAISVTAQRATLLRGPY